MTMSPAGAALYDSVVVPAAGWSASARALAWSRVITSRMGLRAKFVSHDPGG